MRSATVPRAAGRILQLHSRRLPLRFTSVASSAARAILPASVLQARAFSSAPPPPAPFSPSRTALIFPGQGSHRCGPLVSNLESEWPSIVRPVFEELDELLQRNLSRLLRDTAGHSEVQSTELAQPAILAHSIALWRVMQQELGLKDVSAICRVALGHSLGEYTALVAAGSISFAEAVKLVHARGKAMKIATKPGAAGMAAVLCDTRSSGLHMPSIVALLEEAQKANPGSTLVVANLNSPFQVVISGHTEAIEYVKERVNKGAPGAAQRKPNANGDAASSSSSASASPSLTRGILKVVSLDVSGPFHSPLMSPASAALDDALKQASFKPPAVPIIFDVHAHASTKSERFAEYLTAQLTASVLWHPSIVHAMTEHGIREFIELGPSTPLSALLKSTAARLAKQTSIADPMEHPADAAAKNNPSAPHPSILPLIMPRPRVVVDDGVSVSKKDSASILAGLAPAWSDVRTIGVSSVQEMRSFLQLQSRPPPVEV